MSAVTLVVDAVGEDDADRAVPPAVAGASDVAPDRDEPAGSVANAAAAVPFRTWVRRVRHGISVAGALRLVGGGALVLALVDFLLAGVTVQNDLQRFVLLLAQSGLFAGGAFALERLFGDGRGARLLLGIALLSVPAGFAVLGAMLYSLLPLDGLGWLAAEGWLRGGGAATSYPDFARWQAGGWRDLGVGAAAALATLVPTTLFAMAVMARRSARWLAPAFLASAATLLVPLRDPSLIAPLVATSVVALVWLLVRRRGGDPPLATVEARFARAALFVPPAVVAGRALLMYPPDAVLGLALAVSLHALSRWTVVAAAPATRLRWLLYPMAAASAVAVAVQGGVALAAALGAWALPLAVAIGATLLVELRRQLAERRLWLAIEGTLALAVLVPIGLGALLLAPAASAPMALAAGVVLVHSALSRRTVIGALAVLSIALQLGHFADDVLGFLVTHGWRSLVAGGLLAVVAAAALERRGVLLRRRPSPASGEVQPAGTGTSV